MCVQKGKGRLVEEGEVLEVVAGCYQRTMKNEDTQTRSGWSGDLGHMASMTPASHRSLGPGWSPGRGHAGGGGGRRGWTGREEGMESYVTTPGLLGPLP